MLLSHSTITIDDAVFTTLLDNSVAGTYKVYERALQTGSIRFSDLVDLARKGDIPYSLFFAPIALVREQVEKKTAKLLAGVSRDTFSIGSRAKVELRDVELIVKDLIRKQQLVRKHDSTLESNTIIGLLRSESASIDADAAALMSALGLSHDRLRACRTKEKALDLMIECLEANQVLVARSVRNYMPQRLTHVKFSGMTVRDNKVPYIFLAGGDHGDDQEPVGRTIFTLALMTVLVARRIFAPMTWDGGSTETDPGREYDIAGTMLMPTERMRALALTSLDAIKAASAEFKVTASAVTVRAMRLGMIAPEAAGNHLEQLRGEFRSRPNSGPRSPIHPENAVRKYNGRELTVRMLHALDNGSISAGEFCRSICLNHLKPSRIEDLRRAVQ
ncbi:hypothetical protein [Microbacterium excoecariae]|uniref:hypothetical protein n=1 Tax=Microbacterium excoecariae TaxID=2715210 RepID=UPI0014085C35|nr:hypothetical protein [Microbacterium excoecariae]NHI16784.1 hypothetical protein [Microbacterium excoecariae]